MVDSAPKFKDEYVPPEKRESNNVSLRPFIIETAKFFIIAKLSAAAGYFAAKGGRFAKWGIDGAMGGIIGGTAGGLYELYDHWHKTEKKRLGVKNISGDLKNAMSPEQLEIEARKEAALVADLQKLEEKMATQKPHTASLALQRDNTVEHTLTV